VVWRAAVGFLALAGCRLNFSEAPRDAPAITPSDAAPDAFDLCSRPSTILCDDFSSSPNVVFTGDVQWFASGGYSGGALQVRGVTGSGAGAHWTLPATTDGELNARVHLRVQSSSTVQLFLVLVELNNALATNGQEKVSADLVTNDLYAIGAPYSGGGPQSAVTLTRDQWACVELRVVVSSTAGEVHLLVDGTEVAGRTGIDTLIPTGFHDLILTSGPSSNDVDTIVDYDDLVVARAPIGC
jgi:hypothetical protein